MTDVTNNVNVGEELREQLAEQNAEEAKPAEKEPSAQDLRAIFKEDIEQSVGDLSPEISTKIQTLLEQLKTNQGEAGKKILLQFIHDNPEIKTFIAELERIGAESIAKQLSEVANEAEEGQARSQNLLQLSEKLVEIKSQINPNIAVNLKREVNEILADGSIDPTKAEAIAERLKNASIPEEDIGRFMDDLSSGKIVGEEIGAAIDKLVENSLEATAGMMYDLDRLQQMLGWIGGIDGSNATEETDESILASLREMEKSTEKMLDSLDMPGMIDLIFASNYYGGGKFENWSSAEVQEKGGDKEKKTLAVIKVVFGSEEGAKLFFAKFTETSDPEKVFDNLIGNLEKKLAELETADDEKRKKMRELFSQSVAEAAKTKGLSGIKIEPDQVVFSEDVMRFMIVMAKKHLDSQASK